MQATLMSDGEFKDWYFWPEEMFEHEIVGPFYFREDKEGMACAFRAADKHMNAGGVVHGGCLMSFADFSLFAIAQPYMDTDSYGVTVAFTSEFLSGPVAGDYIEARGEVLRAGGSLIFVRGLITGNGKPVLNFSGTIKRIRPK